MSTDLLPDLKAVYRAPSGRLCRVVPLRDQKRWAHWTFVYIDSTGRALASEFTLAHANLRLLRKVD